MSYRFTATLTECFQSAITLLGDHLTLTVLILVALVAWARFDPKPAARTAQFTVLGCLVLVQIQVLSSLTQGTLERLDASRNAVYSTADDQAGGDTVQYAPRASYQELSSREQTLTFADHTVDVYGLSGLPGWNGTDMEPSDTILNVKDRLEQTPHATIVRRTIDFKRYLSLPLRTSLLALKLDFVPDSVAYQGKFSGSYTFSNPLKSKAVLRFTFPLPEDSGTLQDFHMTVNGKASEATDWEGEVEAGQSVEVKVSYQNRGRRSWTYSPTSRRESIGELRLDLTSDNSRIKFRKDSLFPQAEANGRWTWSLKEVITSQDISLFFPTTPKRELVEKTLSFAPLGLLLYAVALAWAIGPHPRTLAAGCLAYAGGVVLTSYLWTYLSFGWGLAWGVTVGCGLGLWLVGRRGLTPSAVGWLTWLAFGLPGHTGLLLTVLGLALLAAWCWQGDFLSR